MFKRKKKKTGCETPEFRSKVPMPPVKPAKPSEILNMIKSSPVAVLPNDISTVEIMCHYETPCGWCTKWDKKCDKKIGCEPPVKLYDKLMQTNKPCVSEEDHEWECCGMSTGGSEYVCKKCYSHKTVPYSITPLESSFTGNVEDNYVTT